jgi:cysteine desulfurase
MIYLDYSASTPIDPEVARVFVEVESNYFANANATHDFGLKAYNLIQEGLTSMAKRLKVSPREIIITSSAVESNNLAIKGLALKYPNKKHVITSEMEHSSIIGPISYLERIGYEIDFVQLDEAGHYDLDHLASLIREDTLVVSLIAVDSETGIRHRVEACGEVCHQKGVIFHTDMTQTLGKTPFDLTHIDLATFSSHKIYGPKGVGCLIKKEHIELIPLLHGGRSLSIYRASTPQTGLIMAFAKAMELAFDHYNERHQKVEALNRYLKEQLRAFPEIIYNSTDDSLPHVVNFSLINTTPSEILDIFSKHDIYFTSKSACTLPDMPSRSVYALSHSRARALASYRISMSHLTTFEELDRFIEVLKEVLYP